MKVNFRALRADEVDVRVAMVKDMPGKQGVQLLLYKDARCDMNILDETVGPMNWQRNHTRDNANCVVSLWDEDKGQWIAKEDTGTESNTEKEKGLASDSFKRACVNWGIGRELYTAPFIWVTPPAVEIKDKKTYDRFSVREMTVQNGRITHLVIWNETKNCQAYPRKQTGTPASQSTATPIYCEDCKAPITARGDRTAQQMAAASKAKFGRVLCVDCANGLRKKERELDAIATEYRHEDAGDRL